MHFLESALLALGTGTLLLPLTSAISVCPGAPNSTTIVVPPGSARPLLPFYGRSRHPRSFAVPAALDPLAALASPCTTASLGLRGLHIVSASAAVDPNAGATSVELLVGPESAIPGIIGLSGSTAANAAAEQLGSRCGVSGLGVDSLPIWHACTPLTTARTPSGAAPFAIGTKLKVDGGQTTSLIVSLNATWTCATPDPVGAGRPSPPPDSPSEGGGGRRGGSIELERPVRFEVFGTVVLPVPAGGCGGSGGAGGRCELVGGREKVPVEVVVCKIATLL